MNQQLKIIKRNSFLLTLLCMLLLCVLFLFQSIWVIGGSETAIIRQATLQTSRVNILVKDSEIIAYRPQEEKTQALEEMNVILPFFIQTQNGLIGGDTSIGLPTGNRPDIFQAIQPEQLDYLEIVSICKTITTTGKATDAQIQFLFQHERNYTIQSSVVTQAWKNRIDTGFFVVFIIESILTVLTMLFVLFKHVFVTKRIIRTIPAEE